MFTIALTVLIVSYEVFFLGLAGLLKTDFLPVCILATIGLVIILRKNAFVSLCESALQIVSQFSRPQKLFLLLLILAEFVNFIGALGPELGFDALWYHLTLPKLYLISGTIPHITGGLLYYSDMPKLGEMLYTAALFGGSEIYAKCIHFFFGFLLLVSVYLFSRRYISKKASLFTALILAGNLVFAWESTTAYIDIIWAFYAFLALWALLKYNDLSDKKWLVLSAILTGSAITTKLLALPLVPILLVLLFLMEKKKHTALKHILLRMCLFVCVTLLIPLPWFLFSYLHTGNPLYPVFSSLYKTSYSPSLFNPLRFLHDSWNILTNAPDPISPVYLIFLPLLIICFKKFSFVMKLVCLYCLLGFLSWYFLPQTGGGRFLLAYLPAFSVMCGGVLEAIQKNKILYTFLSGVVVFILVLTICYRAGANSRYLPVIFGFETKQHFLTTHLNFSFGDFYDIDNYFKTHIYQKDRILLFGFHNLYYVDFPFVDSSWVKNGDKFNYIATQSTALPVRFYHWQLIYNNPITHVKLYTDRKKIWTY